MIYEYLRTIDRGRDGRLTAWRKLRWIGRTWWPVTVSTEKALKIRLMKREEN